MERRAVHSDVVDRIRSEYEALPGLRLTLPQAQRLWGLDLHTCTEILTQLVESRFLARTRDGSFVRADAGLLARAQSSFRLPS